jgi:hypothetical protein
LESFYDIEMEVDDSMISIGSAEGDEKIMPGMYVSFRYLTGTAGGGGTSPGPPLNPKVSIHFFLLSFFFFLYHDEPMKIEHIPTRYTQ